MTTIKRHKTIKSFYKKYTHKVILRVPPEMFGYDYSGEMLSTAMRSAKIKELDKRKVYFREAAHNFALDVVLHQRDYADHYDEYGDLIHDEPEEALDATEQKLYLKIRKKIRLHVAPLINFFVDLKKEKVQTRRDYSNQLVIYYNGEKLITDLIADPILSKFAEEVWEPANDTIHNNLISNRSLRIVSAYPHGVFKRRVVLKNINGNIKPEQFQFLLSYDDTEVKVSTGMKHYIAGSSRWAPYTTGVYTDCEETLTMLLLTIGSNNVKEIIEYQLESDVVESKINPNPNREECNS